MHCSRPLGVNDSIEHFPVGTRLAFDGARGRLWAVCPHCARWNLAPIEERWEALEECERAYRTAAKRVSTDNIALARLRDGTDLVRIGRPLLPEFAAWRYSRTVLRRTRAAIIKRATPQVVTFGAGLLAVKSVFGAASAASLIALPGAGVLSLFGAAAVYGWRFRQPGALLVEHEGSLRGVSPADVGAVRITYDADHGLALRLMTRAVQPAQALRRALGQRVASERHAIASETRVSGDAALALLPRVLAATNALDATGRLVQEAIERLERHRSTTGDPDRAIAVLAPRIAGYRASLFGTGEAIGHLSPVHRLAAEMALHEDDERRALAGELGALHARWEDAERIARIADGELTRLARAE